ncbi:tRNA 2-selenouridine(34) synthase MnmH [Pseudorhodoferax sp. Leaf267]|uniref:tRNA 2-selenouridine(34) synthase MnmH n=1 Tax=Pseudorhodoferax sp. Leaf267 TaxID=1736316 RepID=UPI0006FDD079|nr:tRNA 2-selenouridine(34) synthase MnmH [Pseudorhodoferax sp. Leaf267]KQP22392.1 tRNA 2-selenouridine synthase [Pseudorhodoferax sp. Leaf267]
MNITRVPAPQAIASLEGFSAIIDARSEDEFALDHMPGAVNWPTLRNEERRIVGTTYKQISAFEARKRGAAMAARNIADHIDRHVLQVPKHWQPLVYCWRGGQRSNALALILGQIGFKVSLVEGGYQAFRRAVIDDLPPLVAPLQWRVVCGNTGTGKTRLLQALLAEGAQVLDLEALASHRASVLGAIPGVAQPSQKHFETRIWERLRSFDPARPVFVESESRKVGNVVVPDALMQAMRAARCVRLLLAEDERVALLLEDYAPLLQDADFLCGRLDVLREMRGKLTVQGWQEHVRAGRFDALVRELLQQHYDPGYEHSIGRSFSRYAQAPVHVARDRSADAMADLARRIMASDEAG